MSIKTWDFLAGLYLIIMYINLTTIYYMKMPSSTAATLVVNCIEDYLGFREIHRCAKQYKKSSDVSVYWFVLSVFVVAVQIYEVVTMRYY